MKEELQHCDPLPKFLSIKLVSTGLSVSLPTSLCNCLPQYLSLPLCICLSLLSLAGSLSIYHTASLSLQSWSACLSDGHGQVVFFSFWQAVVVAILVHVGVIKENPAWTEYTGRTSAAQYVWLHNKAQHNTSQHSTSWKTSTSYTNQSSTAQHSAAYPPRQCMHWPKFRSITRPTHQAAAQCMPHTIPTTELLLLLLQLRTLQLVSR